MKAIALLTLVSIFAFTSKSSADDLESRLKALEDTLKAQQQTISEQQKTIDELKAEINRQKEKEKAITEQAPEPQKPSGETVTAAMPAEAQKPSGLSGLFGGAVFTNPYISVILNTFGYATNVPQDLLQNTGIPGYSDVPTGLNKGFNLDSVELGIFAPVDPYFNLYSTIPITENGISVEEAYFITTALPAGLQLKGGKFLSGFGRLNGQHEHNWSFVDEPLVYRAFTGNDRIDEVGIQLTYLPPLPFYLQLGLEALQGDNEVLFGANAHIGPHAYTAFAKASLDVGDYSTILFGPSVITGDTQTNSVAPDTVFTGTSTLYGFEFTYKWKPSKGEGVIVQSEYLLRHQSGDLTAVIPQTLNSLVRTQDGLYLQGIYQWERWNFGLRYDALGIFANTYELGGNQVNFSKPWRASAEIDFNPSEFARIRLQYNYDRNVWAKQSSNEWFLQFIFGIGAHAAHTF